jgi:regulator of protease activity HflC (stomatin/prohibitin superfamily)
VLRPGLHLLLPWPFGQVRHVEFGVVHAVSVGVATGGTAMPPDTSTADGAAPPSTNRLWDQKAASETSYMIASRSAGRESFETVSADIGVLYRIGLDDDSARRALYGVAEPDALVRALSGRLLAQFFANRTLDEVLGARREQVATQLRDSLQAELDAQRSGVEVVALVVESMHPPGGAAAAYRSVQAAQIIASTRQAEETGRAHSTLSVAARDAHDVRDQAHALAAELIGAAESERWQSDADVLAYRDGGRAFLLERYFSNLLPALASAALEIVDDRLGRPDMPIIDLRASAAISADAPRSAPAAQNAVSLVQFSGK